MDMLRNSTTNKTCVLPSKYLGERIFSIPLFLISVYVLVSLINYTWINRYKKSICNVNQLTILSGSFSFLLSLNKMGEQWIGFFSCSAYHWSAAVFYTLGILVTYTILWARQRRMYSDELMAYEFSKAIRFMSNVIICCIYCTFGISCILFTTTYSFECEYYPCLLKWDPKVRTEGFVMVNIFLVMSFIFQSALFLLLVYPIIKQKSCTAKMEALFRSGAKGDMEKLAKRLGLCAIACVISSGVFGIIVLLSASRVVDIIWCNLATVDLITNTVATVVSFFDWKKRLFSLFLCSSNKINEMTLYTETSRF